MPVTVITAAYHRQLKSLGNDRSRCVCQSTLMAPGCPGNGMFVSVNGCFIHLALCYSAVTKHRVNMVLIINYSNVSAFVSRLDLFLNSHFCHVFRLAEKKAAIGYTYEDSTPQDLDEDDDVSSDEDIDLGQVTHFGYSLSLSYELGA